MYLCMLCVYFVIYFSSGCKWCIFLFNNHYILFTDADGRRVAGQGAESERADEGGDVVEVEGFGQPGAQTIRLVD